MNLKKYIYDVENFPKPGIIFRDITPLLDNANAFKYVIDQLAEFAVKVKAEKIAAPESRGFIFASALAYKLNLPFVLVRKPGKLPRETISEAYDLEYGTNAVSIHKDAIKKGEKVLVVDDLLATGGTVNAATHLVERLGGEIAGLAFVIELKDLNGRKALGEKEILSLIKY